ncbi:MAG: filamentous hemagglutinin N-terminal domain-containing protein, partial [Thiobacillus sp.]|nr:filamentous hemagglutinin N-terminal domain-containing protein [Thiobacillus sp.]
MNTSAASTSKTSRKQTGIRRMIIKLSRKFSLIVTWRPRARVSHLLAMMLAAASGPALALPTDGQVVAGGVGIDQTTDTSLTITQTTDKGIINWRGYSVYENETVTYLQPSTSSVTLNRVTGGDASEILGHIVANGQIFLINPNGVLFGANAQLDVGGMVASTLDISNEDFLAGRYVFQNGGNTGSVVNQGKLNGKYVALLGTTVSNSGTITANGGTVALAAGDRVSLDISGDSLLAVSVDAAAAGASISHSGAIVADGGQVYITAKSADALMDTVLNVSGLVRAHSLSDQNGVIRLDGGDTGVVSVTGTLDASGNGGNGGMVVVTGDKVGLFEGARIDASGATGGGTVLVGGNYQGQGPERNASMTYVAAGASIDASATGKGDGGTVVVWGTDSLRMDGAIRVRGGAEGGDGGFVETSSHGAFSVTRAPDMGASQGQGGLWLIDPIDLTIDNTADSEVYAGTPFAPAGEPATITWATIDGGLLTGDVVVTTVGTTGAGTGNITIADAGVLVNGNKLTISAADSITVGADITRSAAGDLELLANGGIDVGANITLSGASALALTATTGAVNQTAGTITANGGVTIDTATNGSQNALAVIAGTGGLTKSGSGTFTLHGVNTYSGTTTISAGTLELAGAGDTINDNSAVTVAGGATLLMNENEDVGSLNGAGSVNLNTGAIGIGADGGTGNFSGVISGSSNLHIKGGNQTLTGTNTFTGSVNIDGGTLTLSGANNVLADTININVNGGALAIGSHNETVTGVTLASGSITGSTGVLTANTYAVQSGTISAILGDQSGGTSTLTKTTAGTVTLSGNNLYEGLTTISAGTLTVSHAGGLGTIDAGTTVANGATLNINGVAIGAEAVTAQGTGVGGAGAITGSGSLSGAITMANHTTVGVASGTLTLSGVINETPGDTFDLTKSGAGTLVLTANNNYDGATAVSAGTLVAQHDSALGDVAGGVTVASGATLVLDNADVGAEAITVNGGTLALTETATALAVTFGAAGSTLAYNTSSYGSYTGAVSVNQELGTTTGITTVTNFGNIGTLVGNGTNTTITGVNAGQTFAISADNTGTAGLLDFSGVTNLVGGSGSDTVTGTSGDDAFTVSGTNAGSVAGMTFSGMETLDGAGGSDTLTGTSGADTFVVSGANAGSVAGMSFSGMESLDGAAGADSFTVQSGGSLTGGIDGGADSDTLDLSGKTTVAINLSGTGTTDVASVAGIESYVGNGTDTTLTGTNTGSTYTISAANSGDVDGTITFSGVTSLVGGSGSDTLTGTSGADTFVVSGANAGSVAGMSFSGMESLDGAAGA